MYNNINDTSNCENNICRSYMLNTASIDVGLTATENNRTSNTCTECLRKVHDEHSSI